MPASPSTGPAFQRLPVDERRRRLLAVGEELFQQRSYDELSMAQIARAAGISKGLLYHYFPSKRELFLAAYEQVAADLAARVEPPAGVPLAEALAHALDAYLAWVTEHETTYVKLVRGASRAEELAEVVDGLRAATRERIVAAVGGGPAQRVAVAGWLWGVDGALLDWLAHRDVPAAAVRDLLARSLLAALAPAAAPGPGVGGLDPG